MQIKKFLLTGLLFALYFPGIAQQAHTAAIAGKIINYDGFPVPSASIVFSNSSNGIVADQNGRYKIEHLAAGNYSLSVSAIGLKKVKKTFSIKEGEQLSLNIQLESDVTQMDEVAVIGRTENQEINRQAYNVTSIDAQKLHNTTLDLSHALDRVSGVRVRETGGVGSSFSFSLNGFTGNQVKFFIDGVPMDNFGSSFQINNIPINLAERVEVYKGVVPIWLGADALGGAINIVTGNTKRTYVDASYSFGSFNTHRSAVNAAYTAESGLTFQLNAYQNYSDNNYWVTVDVADINTGAYYPNQRVRRFHDTYRNEMLVAHVGVLDKKYADRLLIGMNVGQNYKEIQTGARMVSVFGDWHTRGNMLMPTLKYQKKDLFIKGFDITVNANYNLGSEQSIDTAFRRYNWFGDYKEYDGAGSERSRTMNKFNNHNGIGTGTLSYIINDQHSITANNVFTTFNRKQSDELYPEEARFRLPQKSNKNTTGVAYKFDYKEKWSTSLFSKHYLQKTTYASSYNPSGNWGDVAYLEQKNTFSRLGYGIASSYFLLPTLQVKASYEKSNRLPENEELFGDMINQQSNFELRPESSDNLNIGLSYQTQLVDNHQFLLSGNFIYRNAKDFIRARLNNNQTMLVMENIGNVRNTGADAEVRYSYKKGFTAGINLTYQDIRNMTEYEPESTSRSLVYRDRMPNMPFFFGNADASVFMRNVGGPGNTLSVGYNLLYVHAYYLYWPSQGSSDSKYDIPKQLAHDANVVYTLADGRYNIALECKNLLDARLFDNFSLQKPSRGYYLKLRYFVGK